MGKTYYTYTTTNTASYSTVPYGTAGMELIEGGQRVVYQYNYADLEYRVFADYEEHYSKYHKEESKLTEDTFWTED